MGEEQQSVMGETGGILWEAPGVLFCLALFCLFEFIFASLSWQPYVYHEYKETLELISIKRHYSAHSPPQHKFALSEGGIRARKWVLRWVLPGCLDNNIGRILTTGDYPLKHDYMAKGLLTSTLDLSELILAKGLKYLPTHKRGSSTL